MEKKDPNERSFVLSYLTLRQALGWLGLLLPFVLLIGNYYHGHVRLILPSISHYYYSAMGDVFVGSICAVGVFLLSYRGHDRIDNRVSNVAGFLAIIVAFTPTSPLDCSYYPVRCMEHDAKREAVHLVCAAAFFIVLACMSIFLFTKTNKASLKDERMKRIRNWIYRVCGIVMIASIGIIIIFSIILQCKSFDDHKWIFVFESISLLAFGFSWLIKGETFFQDKAV